MSKNSILTHSDYENFLVHLYFGRDGDYLLRCVRRAYLDFSRTLHGLGKLASKDVLRKRATSELRRIFSDLKGDLATVTNQAEFDTWHRATCQRLSAIYKEHGYHRFYVGQAQKWVNMTFKYIFTLGENRIPGFGGVYEFCHAPLDRVLIERLAKYGFPRPPCAWSRLDNYDEYLKCQCWIQQHFELLPLDVEFRLWSGRDIDAISAA